MARKTTKTPTPAPAAEKKTTRSTAAANTVKTLSISPRTQVTDEDVRRIAYLKWEAAGKPTGNEIYYWLEAERELGVQ